MINNAPPGTDGLEELFDNLEAWDTLALNMARFKWYKHEDFWMLLCNNPSHRKDQNCPTPKDCVDNIMKIKRRLYLGFLLIVGTQTLWMLIKACHHLEHIHFWCFSIAKMDEPCDFRLSDDQSYSIQTIDFSSIWTKEYWKWSDENPTNFETIVKGISECK